MKKCLNICIGGFDLDVDSEQSEPEMELPWAPSPAPSLATHSVKPSELQWHELPNRPNIQKLRVMKHNNAFTIGAVRFSPDDIAHNVVIRFDKDGGMVMKLVVDGAVMLEVDTKLHFRGNYELSIDGKVIDFLWDVTGLPMRFSFRTRVGAGGGGGESSGDEGCGEQWEKLEECYSLLIFGI